MDPRYLSAMHRIVGPFLVALMALASTAWAQDPPGKEIFEDRCGTCHGADGNGGEHARGINRATPDLNDSQLTTLIREGLPARGMPAVNVSDAELPPLIAFVRTLKPRGGFQPYRKTLRDEQRQDARRPGAQRRIGRRASAFRR